MELRLGRAVEWTGSAEALEWQLTWFVQGTSKRPERLEDSEQGGERLQVMALRQCMPSYCLFWWWWPWWWCRRSYRELGSEWNTVEQLSLLSPWAPVAPLAFRGQAQLSSSQSLIHCWCGQKHLGRFTPIVWQAGNSWYSSSPEWEQAHKLNDRLALTLTLFSWPVILSFSDFLFGVDVCAGTADLLAGPLELPDSCHLPCQAHPRVARSQCWFWAVFVAVQGSVLSGDRCSAWSPFPIPRVLGYLPTTAV